MSDLCAPNYSVRPAIAAERWQIQRLLTYFAWESPRRSRRGYYLVLGFLLAIVISLSFLIGLMFLLGVGCGIAFSFIKMIFSQEWKKFWIIEQEGRIVACGKLCCYSTYSVLYDVMVLPQYRRQGIGSALVQHLSKHASKPLYLACFPDKIGFYTQLGFMPMGSANLSFVLRHELGISTQPDFVVLVLR
jgi:N-acetylglutamate synthase-like GNAT family acetyltransferase